MTRISLSLSCQATMLHQHSGRAEWCHWCVVLRCFVGFQKVTTALITLRTRLSLSCHLPILSRSPLNLTFHIASIAFFCDQPPLLSLSGTTHIAREPPSDSLLPLPVVRCCVPGPILLVRRLNMCFCIPIPLCCCWRRKPR